MIKLENFSVYGLAEAIHGMRNPKNSWAKSDSTIAYAADGEKYFKLGETDKKLAMALSAGGPVHGKFKRMITVYVDITAPLYWWKEFDTYKVGTVADSCSTMHKIQEKEFEPIDFSTEHLLVPSKDVLYKTIDILNAYRYVFNLTKKKEYWWQMIQLLPTSYNQKRTVMMNYEVLTNIYQSRKGHKLDEWHTMRKWIESLPYSELITGGTNDESED